MGEERQRAALARNKENSSRLAFADFTFEVTDGDGYFEFPDGGTFGLAFAKKPIVTFGVILDTDALADAMGLPEGSPAILPPLVTGYVHEWELSDRDFYIGAWCGVLTHWVNEDPETIPVGFTYTINFAFQGIGIKDVDPEVRE